MHILYNDRDMLQPLGWTCGMEDGELPAPTEPKTPSQPEKSSTANTCVPIYIECDYQTYLDFQSSVTEVADHIGIITNASATLYNQEQVSFGVADIFVWTTVDPHRDLNDPGFILSAFGRRIKDNFEGRLAHFLTTKPIGGGVAWLDVVCENYNVQQDFGPYAVSGLPGDAVPLPAYSFDVLVFAHEMGHNWGARHTHACAWGPNRNQAIDGCFNPEGNCGNPGTPPAGTGTVMSYCHLNVGTNLALAFTPANFTGFDPGDQLRETFNSGDCLLECVDENNGGGGGDGECPITLNITANPLTENRTASGSITTQGTVEVNGTVSLSAPTVTLSTGFFAPQGSTLTITTTGCDGEPPTPTVGTCEDPILVACGTTINGNTAFGVNNFNSYDCFTDDHSGPELVYQVTTTQMGDLQVNIDNVTGNNNPDLDIFILTDCNDTDCLASGVSTGNSDQATYQNAPAGTYTIIIDGYQGSVGAFDLTVNCIGDPLEDGTCDAPITIECGQTLGGNTANGENNFETQNCVPFNYSGKELIYQLTTTTAGDLTVRLDNIVGANDPDLDIFIADACSNTNCLAYGAAVGSSEIAVLPNAPAGTYFIIIEGYDGSVGAFDITVECMETGTCANPIPLGCTTFMSGNTVGQANNFPSYICSGFAHPGSELVYEITTTQTGDIEVNLDDIVGADLDVFILDDCTDTDCLASGESTGTSEQAILSNAPPGTYTIVVDGFDGSGSFDLSVFCAGGGSASNALAKNPPTFRSLTPRQVEQHVTNLSVYPNPFSDKTMIAFTLPDERLVNITLHDVTGRQIKTLADRQLLSSGVHQLELDGSQLQAGVYFLNWSSGSDVFTRKLVIMNDFGK